MYTAYLSNLVVVESPDFRHTYNAARDFLREENGKKASAVICREDGSVVVGMLYLFHTMFHYRWFNDVIANFFKPDCLGDEYGKLYEIVKGT